MTSALALTRPEPTMDARSLELMLEQAERYVSSGLLPNTIKTPQQALIIMAQGRELGIPATVALRGIVVVQGKPTCSAELMMALVHRTYGQSAMRVFRTDNDACTVQYRQQGWDGVSEYTFSMDDAKRANLLKNPTWQSYPAAMLRARAISAVVRFAFPECISGVYAPGELGDDVTIVDGEPVSTGSLLPAQSDEVDFCDVDYWNKRWHATVKGTRFEAVDTRHKFVSWYTKGAHDSLGGFLKAATTDEAAALVTAVEHRIALEARKARAALIEELSSAVKLANSYADLEAEPFEIPSNVDEIDDATIREMIRAATQATEAATTVSA